MKVSVSHISNCLTAGTDHTLILTRGGEVYSWGTGGQGQLGRVGARMTERHMHVSMHAMPAGAEPVAYLLPLLLPDSPPPC